MYLPEEYIEYHWTTHSYLRLMFPVRLSFATGVEKSRGKSMTTDSLPL
jgi:hypothetical protein